MSNAQLQPTLKDVIGEFASHVTYSGATGDLRRLIRESGQLVRRSDAASYDRGAAEAVLAVVEAVQGESGLAAQTSPFEPGSLVERLLLEVAGGVHGANADLADRLGTDQWQLSRAGRRLRDLGLAERKRAGRLNVWTLTPAGRREASRIRGDRGRRSGTP